MAPLANQVLFAAGGDVVAKYGTLVWRKGQQSRGGEIPYTFARAGGAHYFAKDVVAGGLQVFTAATGNARLEQLIDPVNGVLQNYLKLEPLASNSCLQSETLDNATWTKSNSSITANAVVSPDGTTTADALVESATGPNGHSTSQPITITAGENVAISCFVRANSRTKFDLECRDATETNAFAADFDASTGLFIQNRGAGAGVVINKAVIALANGWYWIGIWGTLNAGVTAAFIMLRLHDASNNISYTGDGASNMYFWGAQLERNGATNAAPPTSYMGSVGTAGTRPVESWTVPWHLSPRECWAYLRFIERGTVNLNPAGGPGPFYIGNAAGADPSFQIYQSGGKYRVFHANGVSNVGLTLGTAPVFGNVVELLALLRADGSVELRQSINGAAETTTGQSGTLAFAAAWSGLLLILGGTNTAGGTALSLFSRALVGLGAGTTVTQISDVRGIL